MICRICDSSQDNTAYKVFEMMYGTKESFDYFKCNSCGCLQISEIPKNIENYYPRNYYSYSLLDESKFIGLYGRFKLKKYEASLDHIPYFNKIFHYFFKTIEYNIFREFKVKRHSSILDVGTGDGHFLYPLMQIGFTDILGIDPFIEKDITYASGLKVLKKTIFDVTSKWDVINYDNVFEHVENPQKELNHISSILKSRGICLLTVPTVDSYAWRKYGINWYQIDAPRHYYLHSKKSIEILAKQAGLKVEKVIYNSIYTQFYYSELYQLGIPMCERPKIKGLKKIIWKLKKFRYNRKSSIANKSNYGDLFTVVLRKE